MSGKSHVVGDLTVQIFQSIENLEIADIPDCLGNYGIGRLLGGKR